MATDRLSFVSVARYTSPIPPAPSGAVIAYGPSREPGARAIAESRCADSTRRPVLWSKWIDPSQPSRSPLGVPSPSDAQTLRAAAKAGNGDGDSKKQGRNARVPESRILFDLFAEDDWRNVYAGEREVRPPGAPTTAETATATSCLVGNDARHDGTSVRIVRISGGSIHPFTCFVDECYEA